MLVNAAVRESLFAVPDGRVGNFKLGNARQNRFGNNTCVFTGEHESQMFFRFFNQFKQSVLVFGTHCVAVLENIHFCVAVVGFYNRIAQHLAERLHCVLSAAFFLYENHVGVCAILNIAAGGAYAASAVFTQKQFRRVACKSFFTDARMSRKQNSVRKAAFCGNFVKPLFQTVFSVQNHTFSNLSILVTNTVAPPTVTSTGKLV